MKYTKPLVLATMMFLLIIGEAYTQSITTNPEHGIDNYAMLIRNINHLNPAIKTVEMLQQDSGTTPQNFEVVICGKAVKDLKPNADLLKKAENHGITLSVCGMSLTKFSITEDQLPEYIKVVPNGLIRIFELQKKGYLTITL